MSSNLSNAVRVGRRETRIAILNAARRRLEREGYHATSLGEVAREAGVSRQAVYLHFGSKVKLLTSLIQHVNDSMGMGDRLQAVAQAPSGEAAMERWVELNAKTVPEIYDIVVQLDVARRSEPEADAVWRVPVEDRRLWCLRITRRLAREGRLAKGWTASMAADMLWAMTMPHLFEDLVIERGWTRARYVAHVLMVLRRAMLGDARGIGNE